MDIDELCEMIEKEIKWHENNRASQDVRNGGNGWIYCRDTVVPDRAKQEAVKASKALGMDFCAIDILYNSKTKVATVLEANDLLRSTFAIALREGVDVNWVAFRKQVDKALIKQRDSGIFPREDKE